MKQITISGIIGWDATAANLRDELKAAGGGPVELVISSPGGFVGEGLEMFNMVRNYKGQTTARLSGYAMSMASYIPLAADRIVAEDNAIYMIHNVRGGVWGDHNDILNFGESTKGMSRLIARAYAKKTGKSAEEIAEMMDKETYLFGEDIVDAGFADEVVEAAEKDDDDEAAALMAKMAFDDCMNRMAADVAAVKADLTKAAALAGRLTTKPRAQAKPSPADKGAKDMTLEQMRAEHPELVAAIEAEARAGMHTAEELDSARSEGAAAENQRINDVRAQLIPGHEALIEQLAADGKTTGAQAAMAIIAAEKSQRIAAAAAIDEEAPAAVPAVAAEAATGKTMKRKDFDALSQDKRRAFLADGGKITD
jgi:ATP-dependent protease ClpP protease subunit